MAEKDLIRWEEMVRELCAFTKMTNLGRRIGVSYKEIKRWKEGKARPHPRHQEALIEQCNFFGINWKKFKWLTPIYDFRNTYDKNVSDGPSGLDRKHDGWIPPLPTSLFGLPLNSPLGVPASVLTISHDWVQPLTELGFDIITAKTCRSREMRAHPLPNAFYLAEHQEPIKLGTLPKVVRATPDCPSTDISKLSMANSFGMPSTRPEEWQADLQRTKSILKDGQILISSVVGTADKAGSTSKDLISDFVKCAKLAYEATPHAIELNISCPNVYGMEGSVYKNPELAGEICHKVKKEIKDIPLLIKIGYLPPDKLNELFDSTYKYVDGYTAINTLEINVVSDGQREEPAFPGSGRPIGGISGVAIRDHALDTVRRLRQRSITARSDIVIIGVGGISSAIDVRLFLDAGADAVQICTALLHNRYLGIEIRKQMYDDRDRDSMIRSSILERTGLTMRFNDAVIAKAMDVFFRTCDKMRIEFEPAFRAFYNEWLADRLNEIVSIDTNPAPQKYRREAPTTAQIEAWINNATRKNRF